MKNDVGPKEAKRVLQFIQQMLLSYFWESKIKEKIPVELVEEDYFIPVENAITDSSLIAIRAFYEFLTQKDPRKDDLVVAHFDGFNIPNIKIDNYTIARINKICAHITKNDTDVEQHGFPYKDMLNAVIPAAVIFCDYIINQNKNNLHLAVYAQKTKKVIDSVKSGYCDI